MSILLTKTVSGLDRTKQAAFDRLVQQYEDEMDPAIPLGIHYAPDDDLAIAGISQVDGTAGIDARPPFVIEDDERINA